MFGSAVNISNGILECWNTEDPRVAEWDLILQGWHESEDKIRPSSAFDSQYSIIPSFHYSTGIGSGSMSAIQVDR